jgi:hypothetical protein
MAKDELRSGALNRIALTTLPVPHIITIGTANSPFFIADAPYEVISITEVHAVVGGAAAACQPEKLTGTTASGLALTTAVIDLTTTINTVQTATLTATLANRLLAVGDRLNRTISGTAGSYVGVMTITLKRID